MPTPTQLQWSKVKKTNGYVLRDTQGTELASLTFDSWYSYDAMIRIGETSYRIHMPSWWKQTFEITKGGKGKIGGYRMQWSGKSTLELGGTHYVWTWANWWATQWKWVDAHQRDVMRFQLKGFWQQDGAAEIVGDAGTDELLLAAIGWHVLIVSMRNASSAGGAF